MVKVHFRKIMFRCCIVYSEIIKVIRNNGSFFQGYTGKCIYRSLEGFLSFLDLLAAGNKIFSGLRYRFFLKNFERIHCFIVGILCIDILGVLTVAVVKLLNGCYNLLVVFVNTDYNINCCVYIILIAIVFLSFANIYPLCNKLYVTEIACAYLGSCNIEGARCPTCLCGYLRHLPADEHMIFICRCVLNRYCRRYSIIYTLVCRSASIV